jgi:phenol hydroxylase P3 protein
MDWMSQKYPETFDKYYRARFEYYRDLEKQGKRFYNATLPMLCQTCQIPLIFSEPDDPTQTCYRESDYSGMKYHFCSDGCKDIFDHEPEKYVQAWLPVHQIYQGNCFNPGTDPTVKGFDPLAAVLEYYHFGPGDNMDYVGSPDEANWLKWKGLSKEEPAKKAA